MKGILHFAKMEGGGNDFVVIDDTGHKLGKNFGSLAKKLCQRKYSVGGDGLLVIKKSPLADIRMKYFNSDGSLANFCGNGARCVSYYAYKKGFVGKKFTLESDAGVVPVFIKKDSVKLGMAKPKDIVRNLVIKADSKEWTVHSLNTGVPHAVIFLSSYKGLKLEEAGRAIRHHQNFQPSGTNVNFVVAKDKHHLSVRTYERGVEAETLACGTGSVASSLAAALDGVCETPVHCKTTGGEILTTYFEWNKSKDGFKDVFLEGPAHISFEGEVVI